MHIAVIAANGRTGMAFVRAALAAGHSVRAGVFGAAHMPTHPNLTVQPCDGTNLDDVRRLIAGQEAVVSLIGHVQGSPAHVQTDTIRNVLTAMTEAGISRLVSLTGTGVRFPGDAISILDRILNASISAIDPKRIKDGIDHVELITKSSVDWTVIRVLKLQNMKRQAYTLRPHGPARLLTARATVADAILTVLAEHTFVKEVPVVGP